MILFLTHESKRYIYDSTSGACVPLTSLQYKVAEILDFPLSPVCPTSVRYSLAKYESSDVKRAYAFIYELYKNGVIGKEGNEVNFLKNGEYACSDALIGIIKEKLNS